MQTPPPTAPLKLPPFVRGERLWHVSDTDYALGQPIGPYPGLSHHWLRMQADPKRGAVEQVFENLRPLTMVSRMSCVFGTDSPSQIGSLISGLVAGRGKAVVYRVEVPAHANVSGRFDMALVTSTADPQSAARAYWTGAVNTSARPRPEILASEFLVVESFGAKFSEDALAALKYRDITPAELVNGYVDLAPA